MTRNVDKALSIEHSLTQIYPQVWRLIAANPSPMTGPGTNAYFVGQNRVVIIDPGPALPEHMKNIHTALEALDAAPQAILVTHPHQDHEGCAAQLAYEFNIPLLRFREPLAQDYEIELDCGTLSVHHTPGHIHDHVSLWWHERQLLFAGDLVAGAGTILVIPPEGNMADYLNSLNAMKSLPAASILPGHGPVIDSPQELLQAYVDHRLQREQQVLYWYTKGHTTSQAIAAQIYADQPPEVLGIASLQVEAHLEKLRVDGLI